MVYCICFYCYKCNVHDNMVLSFLHILKVCFSFYDSSNKGNGPWLLFVSESGYGKRVPLSSFRLSPLNRVGLIGCKVWWPSCHLLSLFPMSCSLKSELLICPTKLFCSLTFSSFSFAVFCRGPLDSCFCGWIFIGRCHHILML